MIGVGQAERLVSKQAVQLCPGDGQKEMCPRYLVTSAVERIHTFCFYQKIFQKQSFDEDVIENYLYNR